MTYPTYTKQQLEVKTLTELKSLYTAIGCTRQVADKRSKESWALAIIRFQEEQAVKIDEPKTCNDCPQFDAVNGCCKLFNMVAKPHWAMTNDCISEMECVNTVGDNIKAPAESSPVAQQSSSTDRTSEIDIPGHSFAIANGFTFYQKECDVLCWIGRKDKYRTIAYPNLKDAVQEALRRLKKEGVSGANELLQIHIEAKKAEVQATAITQSGDITFKQVSPNTYSVFSKGLNIGAILKNSQGQWAIGGNERYVTPYLAAAALVESQMSLLDKPVTELTKAEWTGLKQTVSVEVETQIEALLAVCEVDGDVDSEFGTLYKLWHNTTLLGTFYRSTFVEDRWLARPIDSSGVFDADSEECARYWLAYAHITGDYSGDKSGMSKARLVAA